MDSVILDGTLAKKKKLMKEPGHHIVTYESSWRLIHSLEPYDVVIFDEALKLQNGATKVGKHWRELSSNSPTLPKWALSGAPYPESELQLANQMFILRNKWFGESIYQTYTWKFWTYDELKYKYKPKSPTHRRDCQLAFESESFRVSQKDLKMGEKAFEVRFVNASKSEEKLLEENLKEAISPIDKQLNHQTAAIYRQASSAGIDVVEKEIVIKNPSKLEAVVSATKDFLEESPATQIVVMVKFVNTGKWLSEELDCPFIYGGTSSSNRDKAVKGYQSGRQRVLVCQVDAVKMGLDFSANGNGVLIYAEHSWSGDTFIQSTQRAVNIKRKSPALIITFCLKFKEDCIDKSIYDAVKNKQDFNSKLLEKK